MSISDERIFELRRVGEAYTDWSGRSRKPHNGDKILELADALIAERQLHEKLFAACVEVYDSLEVGNRFFDAVFAIAKQRDVYPYENPEATR